jgi:hypothetical protein
MKLIKATSETLSHNENSTSRKEGQRGFGSEIDGVRRASIWSSISERVIARNWRFGVARRQLSIAVVGKARPRLRLVVVGDNRELNGTWEEVRKEDNSVSIEMLLRTGS